MEILAEVEITKFSKGQILRHLIIPPMLSPGKPGPSVIHVPI